MTEEVLNAAEIAQQNNLLQAQNNLLCEENKVDELINVDLIIQQNKLLQEQNALLRERNELLRQSALIHKNDFDREVFIENIDRDEMRDGFLVTAHKKKLWNVLIGILKEFDRICKKHDIRWFAIGGTLLGAARHKGFIPWDDDIDVVMFRPDYEKFKRVVEEELKYRPYFRMWYWFNYRLETDSEAAQHANWDLPFISREQMEKYPLWAPFYPLIRLTDERTTYLMRDERENVFNSVWIDILCLDPCPPFTDNELLRNFNMAHELLLATVVPEKVKAALINREKFISPPDKMLNFLKLPYKTRAQQFDLFLAKHFVETPYVSEITYQTIKKLNYTYKFKDFENTVYLPFEKIEIPVPAEYDSVLTDRYGNWRKFVVGKGHANTYSTDISYKEYFSKLL